MARSEHKPLQDSARRKDIYIARHPETRHGGTPGNQHTGQKREGDNLSFSQDAASKIGATERTVERSVRRAEKICGKAKELIRGTETGDSGVYLGRRLRILKSFKSLTIT